MRTTSLLVCALALAAVGCGDSSTPATPTSDLGETRDVPSPKDVAPPPPDKTAPVDVADVSTPPEVAVDVVADVPSDRASPPPDARDAGPVTCTASAQCADHELGFRVCDTATGRCVECTTNERGACATGQYCDATNRCASGCGADSDCTRDGRMGHCDTTARRCVACTMDDHCPAGQVCDMGSCAPGCNDRHACPTAQACCNGTCTPVQDDAMNCGACARVCTAANATARCASGACGVGACNAGYGDCDTDASNGCETDTQTSVVHCGGCGMACAATANATASCVMGRCQSTCNVGFGDCDVNATNGCETDTRASVMHCGACGRACPAVAHATPTCAMATCGFTCDEGFADCDTNAANGCETDTRTSVMHCGRCAMACPAVAGASATCAAGRCGFTCDPGSANCDGTASNGCEANLSGTASCGVCGNACTGGTPFCSVASDGSASCVSGCTTGQLRCGSECVNPQTDPDHCSGCGAACPAGANATRTCVAGRCGLACATGFADCDGDATNGCETDTRTSVTHCGRCNNACPMGTGTSGRACAAGQCAVTCAAGRGDCDMNVTTGCEADLAADASHCGACGRSCGDGYCASGACLACGACSTGRDGAFMPAGSLTLVSGTYRFTSVTIPSGVTVRVRGSAPLRIYSTGPVRILGTLDLSGDAGGEGPCGNNSVANGGVAGAGGGAGGVGGYYTGSAHVDPTPGSGNSAGRGGGAGGGASVGGGGGGGGHGAAGVSGAAGTCCAARCGSDSTWPGGAGGAAYGDMALTMLTGGSGGGGGAFGGADNGVGGGGGGGGGAVLVVAPTIEVSGAVLANGGNGGNESPTCDGGGGGGGSGGAIWLRARQVMLSGRVTAAGGTGGTTDVGPSCGRGGVGGNGSVGRVRIDAMTITGSTTPTAFLGAFACSGAPCE